MYHELYIDVFFLENLMMDSLLLLLLNRILKCGRPAGRLFLCGALGSLLTCAMIAFPFVQIVKLLAFHLVINSLMLLLGLGINRMIQFVRAYILLYAVSVAMGGFMMLFLPYMRYISLFYCTAFGSYFVIVALWKVGANLMSTQSTIVSVTLYTERGEITVNALWDTGNRLQDFVTGAPVSVIDPSLLSEITDQAEKEKGFHMIPYKSIAGESVMKVFRIHKMCVHFDLDRWVWEPVIGVADEAVNCENEYAVILNPGIFQR